MRLSGFLAGLRRAFSPSGHRPEDVAAALGHVQAFDALVRQCAFIDRLERMAERSGRVIADAVGAVRSETFVVDGRDGLRHAREAAAPEGARGGAEPSYDVLRGVLAIGIPRVFDGAPDGLERLFGAQPDLRILAVPLRAGDDPVGVLCLAVKRPEGFDEKDIRVCERFGCVFARLLHAASRYREAQEGRRAAEDMAMLLIGRERRMRELKERVAALERL